MKPQNLQSKIFLDSGDSTETRDTLVFLGFLDGQTTNPTLVSKNPKAQERFAKGEKFTEQEIYDFYKKVVTEVSQLLPNGSVSIEVYADATTKADQMIKQAEEFYTWIPNAHIKLPITSEGLKAVEQLTRGGVRLNMTLCFTQEQAAAVYSVTRGAKKGDIFVSPFVGRLDDQGEDGMSLIKNIMQMYEQSDGHVEVLTASVRNMEHFLCALKLKSDIITVPFKVLKEWAEKGRQVPGVEYSYDSGELKQIPYVDLDLNKNWQGFDIGHELTDKGIERFAEDWNKLIK